MPFTDIEIEYLSSQRLGRLATAQPDGTLQVSPVGFRYNDRTGTIDIAGRGMAVSRTFRNVAENGQWQHPRGHLSSCSGRGHHDVQHTQAHGFEATVSRLVAGFGDRPGRRT